MSIYENSVLQDIDDIFSDDDGFAVEHDLDGLTVPAIVHAAALSSRSSILELSEFGADLVVLVRLKDYTPGDPTPGAVFFLDGLEYRVQNASRCGGYVLKISLVKACV